MPKVLISDQLSPAAVQIFKDRGVDVEVGVAGEPALEAARDAFKSKAYAHWRTARSLPGHHTPTGNSAKPE